MEKNMKNRSGYLFLALVVVLGLSACSKSEHEENKKEIVQSETEVVQDEKEDDLIEVAHPIFIAEGVRKIAITKEGKEVLSLSYEPGEYENTHEFWKIKIPYGEYAILDTEEALQLFHKAEKLEFTTMAEGVESVETGILETQTSIQLEFCQTNLEEKEAMSKEAAYDKSTSPSYQAKADSACTLLIGNSDGKGSYYAALELDANRVFLIPEEEINGLLNTVTFELILKVSASPNIDTVKEVNVYADEKTYQMKQEKEKYYLNKQEVEQAAYHAKYTELLSIFVTGEVTEEKKEEKKELLKLSLKRNVEEMDDVEIVYYEYDEKNASVSVNGVEKLLVEKDAVEQLKAGILSEN